nr:hypothetical protein [Tanacetum cinerariifolium]
VLLLAWDRVFKIKDALGNKQYKPEDIQELLRELFNDVQNIHEELAEYINTPGWNRPAFCNNSDDDDEDCTIAVTPNFPITNSLIMENEHLDTIPETESDEFIKSSVENLVSIPNLDSTMKNDRSNIDSYLLESSLNRDTLMISSLKIDSLLAEFAGELIILESIPPGVDEANCDPEEDIYLDSDSRIEEIDLSFNPDDPMPPGIEDDDDDSERDILIFEELPSNYSLSLPVNESFYFDIPSFSCPPAEPPDGNTGILNIKMMGDNSDQKVPMPKLTITCASNQEKSPDLLSHQGLEIFKLSFTCPMTIHGKNILILDVPLFHFYPLDQLKYGGN